MRQDVANAGLKNVFVVLGMLRCGTSVVARGLKTLGIDLGSRLVSADHEWNPKGFWEDKDIIRINARARTILNVSQESVRLIDAASQMDEKLTGLKQFAARLLRQRFAATDCWAFKDPNTSRLLPFWQSVFDLAQVRDNYIIVLRNPLSSARSYHELTGMDVEHGILTWLMYLLSAIEGTMGRNVIVVSYDLMMQNPRYQLERIRKNLQISSAVNPGAIDDFVNAFLDKKLLHYGYTLDDLRTHPAAAISPVCAQVYDCLFKVATDAISMQGIEFLSAWTAIRNEYEKMSSIYAYIDVLLERNQKLGKSIRTMHKSRLWKIIYPLRLIDDALRAHRKKRREKILQEIYG